MVFCCHLVAAAGEFPRNGKELEDYFFVLLVPNKDDADYQCAVFSLEKLKVCRFPGGPMWSNIVSEEHACLIDSILFEKIYAAASPLSILCIDGNAGFKKHICGFALPWVSGMAYVFENLVQVDKVVGLVVRKSKLMDLGLELFEHNGLQIKCCADLDTFESHLDEIDQLLASNENSAEQFAKSPLPYPLQHLKQFFGPMVIAGLMYYYDLKVKIIRFLGWSHNE